MLQGASLALSHRCQQVRLQRYLDTATALQEEVPAIRRALGDRLAIATSLNDLGYFALDLGQQAMARAQV